MTKQMRCWKCGGEMSVTREMIGATARCPHCDVGVGVPGDLFGAPAAIQVSPKATALRRSPAGAAVLNFFFWGAGYVYLGRMWGLWILIPFCILTGIACIANAGSGPEEVALGSVIVANLPGLAMAFHAYKMAGESR
ncbi:MAG: hypothetical protein ABII12_09420 [Planctomycetota bacterium]